MKRNMFFNYYVFFLFFLFSLSENNKTYTEREGSGIEDSLCKIFPQTCRPVKVYEHVDNKVHTRQLMKLGEKKWESEHNEKFIISVHEK